MSYSFMKNAPFILACLMMQVYAQDDGPVYDIDFLKKGIYYSAFAVPLGATALLVDEKPLTESDLAAADRSDVNPLDRPAIKYYDPDFTRGFDFAYTGLLWSPLSLFLVTKNARRDLLPLALMYLEFRVLERTLAGAIKIAVQRPRPFTYNKSGDVPLDKQMSLHARRSFVSGHTLASVGAAVYSSMIFSDYFPDSPMRHYVWGGSLSMATAVAISRYYSGYHYPTDIAAGAVLGAFVGWVIPTLNRTDNQKLSLQPIPNGLSLTARF